MQVRSLQLAAFRNLAATTFEPGPRFNVISGDNGQGKTNFLEALYLVGTLRSFRSQRINDLIAWGEPEARVAARVARGGLEHVYEVALQPNRKLIRLDGKSPRSPGEYFGDVNVVLFAPEDLRILRGGPGGRRRFLDRSVFNRDVTFLDDAQRYARVVRSRNALLRGGQVDLELLAVYDEQLASLGARVVAARHRYVEAFSPAFQAAYAAISGTAATVRLEVDGVEDVAALRAEIAAARRRELSRRQTLVGPHVHDLSVFLDDHDARAFASQGQVRALVLAWKTAEMGFLAEAHGHPPILLLDDVSSELDPDRTRFLFDFLAGIECQCFVTTTHARHVLASRNRLDFQMVAGTLLPV